MLDLENRPPYVFRDGVLPVLISFPHNGSFIPESIAKCMTDDGRSSRDTDWFLERLYDFPESKSTAQIVAEFSRYVIDLNRPRSDESLYPGLATTGLVPAECFDGEAIYADHPPGPSEVKQRVDAIWQPYHQQLQTAVDAMRQQFGYAVLVEAHSIRSEVPRLFPGKLPDFNIGTNHGASCHGELQRAVESILHGQPDYSHVVNGRFVGGFITRHFGAQENVHAIQFELSQSTYLDEETLQWHDAKASQVQTVFREIIQAIVAWNPK